MYLIFCLLLIVSLCGWVKHSHFGFGNGSSCLIISLSAQDGIFIRSIFITPLGYRSFFMDVNNAVTGSRIHLLISALISMFASDIIEFSISI